MDYQNALERLLTIDPCDAQAIDNLERLRLGILALAVNDDKQHVVCDELANAIVLLELGVCRARPGPNGVAPLASMGPWSPCPWG